MYISSKDAQNGFGALLDKAQRMPIMIKRRNRDCAVVLSAEEYERYRKTRVEKLISFADECSNEAIKNGMTQEILDGILAEED